MMMSYIFNSRDIWEIQNCKYHQSSHQRCSVRKGVLRNFAKFAGTPVPESLY